ncbi:MAG: murein biosynthesis integral membrane protein MurJ [Leptospiraceae bacterium]|nr:murein biosynthesis integral membrane protein MurJ [Leptospiraceae bacterium]MCK6381673.1 murein biosynthesis integral membrane protein MurJ [Leptospiraceae bacterium]NUM40433.1 murein biosynthesis integral membrane protein MurJ [Leptospiraceae bacterium]
MKKDNENSASKSIALSFYTFLSRVLGLLRDHYMAVSFGTGWIASAFSVAYRFPNMFRNLLAEGTLSQSFMPLYSDASKVSEEEEKLMSGAVISFLFVLLWGFVAVFIFLAPFFLPTLVGGSVEYSDLVITLSVILFFLIMTASLSSIFMAISNSKNKFFIPSMSPIVLNLSYLFVFIAIFPFWESILSRVKILSYGIVCGGILQLLLQMYYVKRLGYFPKFHWNIRHPAIGKIFKLMLPAVIGGGFYQISLLVDIFLANYIQNQNPGLGAVVSLDYSQRLIQFPTGIVGVALATTTLPSLLSSLKNNQLKEVPKEIEKSLSFCLFLTLPSSVGLVLLGKIIIDSIYFGGKWNHISTETTLAPLIFYSLAVPFFSMNKILTSSYYAFQDTKTPLKVNSISFTINIILNLILMNYFKHAGLALASASSSAITFILLFHNLKKHNIIISRNTIIRNLGFHIIPILPMSIWLYYVQSISSTELIHFFQLNDFSYSNSSRLVLAIGIFPAMIIYLYFAKIFNSSEVKILIEKFQFLNKFKKK